DSIPRDKTTKEIDGKDYAKILFVIGADFDGYEKNLELATELNARIEEKYPGLSRGVITKEGAGTNGVFNQDLSDNALLIEFGGYDNTFEELYRTADVVGEMFCELYWDAEKVDTNYIGGFAHVTFFYCIFNVNRCFLRWYARWDRPWSNCSESR